MGTGNRTQESQMRAYRVSHWHEPFECSGCGLVETGMDATGWNVRVVEPFDPSRKPVIEFFCRTCATSALAHG
jgi:hypothetical protein